MHAEQRQGAQAYLKAQGLQRALFASPASVTWLTGFAAPVQLGPNPFAGGPALAWCAGDAWTLIVLDSYAAAARDTGVEVVGYLGYTIDAPIDGPGQLLAALRKV